MIGLDRLMEIEGVVGAGQFSEDGHIIRQVGQMSDDLMGSAELCVRQNQFSQHFLESLNDKLPRDYGSLIGWIIWGSKFSVVVVGNTRVFVQTTRGDYNQLMIDLVGSEATGPRPLNY